MDLGQRRFWQKKKHLLTIILIIAISASVTGLVFAGYWFQWTWTGFNKTLWDWMQLLIIPVALALGAFLLNRSDQRREQAIAIDNQRETLLQAYLDRMSELLLEKNIRTSQPDDEVRNVARARTLTTLPRLDADRKQSVLNFLRDSGLLSIINLCYANFSGIIYCNNHRSVTLKDLTLAEIDFSYACLKGFGLENVNLKGTNFSWAHLNHIKASHTNLQRITLSYARLSHIDLDGSDLAGADLRGTVLDHVILTNANLSNADLRGANLSNTDLSNADLRGANLSNTDFGSANLQGANLSGANLNGAKLRKEDAPSEHPSMTIFQKEM
jgi:uncharacterized protein YjbI with pentapeptide repeats